MLACTACSRSRAQQPRAPVTPAGCTSQLGAAALHAARAAGLFGGLAPAEWAPVGGVSLGRQDGVFQAGARLQRGRGTAAMRWLVETITLRAAAGSWLFGRLSNLMKASLVKMLSGGAAPAAGKVGAAGSQLAVAT